MESLWSNDYAVNFQIDKVVNFLSDGGKLQLSRESPGDFELKN